MQAIRDLCNTFGVNEPDTLVDAHEIVKGRASFILEVVELTDQVAKTKKNYITNEKKYDTEYSQLTNNCWQQSLMRQNTADMLAHALPAVLSLAVSVTKRRNEVR